MTADAGSVGELRADEALGGGGRGVAEAPAHDPGAARGRPVVEAAAHVVLRELDGERRALADGGAVVVGSAHGQLHRACTAVGLGDVAPDLAAGRVQAAVGQLHAARVDREVADHALEVQLEQRVRATALAVVHLDAEDVGWKQHVVVRVDQLRRARGVGAAVELRARVRGQRRHRARALSGEDAGQLHGQVRVADDVAVARGDRRDAAAGATSSEAVPVDRRDDRAVGEPAHAIGDLLLAAVDGAVGVELLRGRRLGQVQGHRGVGGIDPDRGEAGDRAGPVGGVVPPSPGRSALKVHAARDSRGTNRSRDEARKLEVRTAVFIKPPTREIKILSDIPVLRCGSDCP